MRKGEQDTRELSQSHVSFLPVEPQDQWCVDGVVLCFCEDVEQCPTSLLVHGYIPAEHHVTVRAATNYVEATIGRWRTQYACLRFYLAVAINGF